MRVKGLETSGLNLASKITYGYDEEDFSQESNQNISSVIQHDNTNFSSGFISGRGNLTSTTRWNTDFPTSSSEAITSKIRYDIAGSVVAQLDPMNRKARIEYADVFNDTTTSRNTFAYPTKVYDAANNFSEVKYRFDNGVNVWAKSPTPQDTNNSKGKETVRIYDLLGRLERETLINHGGAYTRYEYSTNGIQSKTYATLTTGAGEIISERWTDGAGRIRYSKTEHPDSTSGWSGSKVEYDILGRVSRSTVPTEINPINPMIPSTWIPAGEDDRGVDVNNNKIWLWTSQEYDWQGRVTRKINTDGTDQLISYDGCGCAGGQVTTVQSELVPRDDQPNTTGRRKQKVYADILGREYKSEFFNWDGNLYSIIIQSFNRRDQVIQISRYAGVENPNKTHQDAMTTFDGHGRLKTRHNPIEDALTETSWIYNIDGTVQQVIDPRGAITSYSYNDSRGLLTQISYEPPANQASYTTIPDSPTVQFQYDNVGNRTSMTIDGVGSTNYSYDELSRLKSETKAFTGLTGNFTIGYNYELSGKLKSVTDPFGATVNYNDDKAGRTTSITGSGFLNVATYAQDIKYRAFGSVKEMTYGTTDNSHISYQFDNRLQVSGYEATSGVISGGYVQRAAYEYFSDGKIKKVNNLVNHAYDQTYKYDYMERLSQNFFGTITNNQNQQVETYSQSLQYNIFDNITSRQTSIWDNPNGFTTSYMNGRKQNSNDLYDALGNIVDNNTNNAPPHPVYDRWKFDAAGNMAEYKRRWYQGAPQTTSFDRTETITQIYDGDGKALKWSKNLSSTQVYPGTTTVTENNEYYIRSSVLDKVITTIDEQGSKKSTKIYTGNYVLAEQVITAATQTTSATSEVQWKYEDINTGSNTSVTRDGQRRRAEC